METDPLSRLIPSPGSIDREVQPPLAYLVVVHKGPTWNPTDFEPLCRLLSRRFAGEVWSFGTYEADRVIGRMRLRVANRPLQKNLKGVCALLRAREWVEMLRAVRQPDLAIVSRDPFMSGLLGLYAARRARGALICEINGVYASPHNTADTRAALVRALRSLARRWVGAFVLHRAAAVRLMFADQLMGFVRLPAHVITREFFDRTNLDAFHPGREERIILGVGHPFRVKGFDLLCQAFLQITDRYPEWKLVLIGHQVPDEVREGGFTHPRIETYPGTKQPKVVEWMARCAIFALPSRTEGIPRVLLEAGAAGKCRLATRVGGVPRVVKDGADGLLVEPESVEQLVVALEHLMADSNFRRNLGESARRRVELEFSEEAYLEDYAAVISGALRGGYQCACVRCKSPRGGADHETAGDTRREV